MSTKKILLFAAYFLTVFGLALFISQTSQFIDGGDDIFFAKASQNVTLAEHVINRYETWSGRITAESFAYLFNGPLSSLWSLVNAIAITTLVFLLYFFTKQHKARYPWWAALFSTGGFFIFLHSTIAEPALLWRTGSTNYLWPITLGLVSLLPYLVQLTSKSKKYTNFLITKPYLWIFFIGSGFLAGAATEQVALSLLFFLTLFYTNHLYFFVTSQKKKSLLFGTHILSFFIVIGALVLFIAPGNAVRFQSEAAAHFPDFFDLTIATKISISVYWIFNKIVHYLSPFLGLILLLTATKNFLERKFTKYIEYIFFGFIGLLGCSSIFLYFAQWEFAILPLRKETITNPEVLLGYIFTAALVFCTGLLLLLPFKKYQNLLNISLFCGALFHLLLISLSPTLDVSGNRTLFVPAVFLFIIVQRLFVELLTHMSVKRKIREVQYSQHETPQTARESD